jgi:hypothetical protein
MLLEALEACAGVTLSAVATAIGIKIRHGVVPFHLGIDATEEQLSTLMRLILRRLPNALPLPTNQHRRIGETCWLHAEW